jgi:hypothetical protein
MGPAAEGNQIAAARNEDKLKGKRCATIQCGFVELQVPAKFINTFGAHGPALSFWPDVLGNMALPPLYKYLRVDGAKKTLGTNTFRHAKPSSFNDIFSKSFALIRTPQPSSKRRC